MTDSGYNYTRYSSQQYANLRDRMITARKHQGCLQEELPAGRANIGNWERGITTPSIKAFIKWANALGFEVRLEKING